MNRSAQEVKHIELPVFLCRRIEKVAQERNISFEDALTFLLSHFFGHKVLATSSVYPEGVSHPINHGVSHDEDQDH